MRAAPASVLMVLLLMVLAPGTPGWAVTATSTPSTVPTPTTPAPAPAPTGSTGRAPLMVILDASGSMKEQDAEGSRIDQARRQLSDVLSALPDDAVVGALVYGTSTGPNTSERARGCTDVTSLAPLAALDQEALDESAAEVVPSGYSPIGRALTQAAATLPTDSAASILLVSDGDDLCSDPDPCETARSLAAAQPALTVNVIGIQPDDAADALFECLTTATGGTYLPRRYPDPDATSTQGSAEASSSSASVSRVRDRLDATLAAGYRRPAQQFRPWGTAVTGGYTADDAPLLAPGDALDSGFTRGSFYSGGGQKTGTVRYYRLALGAGMTPWASATAIGDVRSDSYRQLGLRLSLVDERDDACLPPVEASDSPGERDPLPMVTAQVGGIAPGAAGWSKECRTGEPVYLRVERLGEYRFGTVTPVQLTMRAEPALTGAGDRAATTGSTVAAPAAGDPIAVGGGTNFATAPLLDPGSTAADTIVSGETRFFAVRLGFGQRLAWRVTPIGQGTPAGAAPSVSIQIRNPLGAPVPIETEGEGGPFVERQDDDSSLSGSTTVPVAAANRTSDDDAITRSALPGGYFVLVSMQPSDGQDVTMPYLLTTAVSAADPGASGSYSSAVPPEQSAAGSGSSAAGATSVRADSTAEMRGGTPSWVWAMGAAGVLAVVLAAAVLLSRRRTSGSARPRAGR